MRLKTSPNFLCFEIALSTREKSTLLAGVSCALLSGGSFALGLGEINTSTYLGQYLEARVSLVEGDHRYLASELNVRQIFGKEARSLGIELVNSNYLFVLELTGEGESLGLRVRSRRPVTEPYINLLVSLEWASGSVYREYTLFLDPPPVVSEAMDSLPALSLGGKGEKVGSGSRSEKVSSVSALRESEATSKNVVAARVLPPRPASVFEADTAHYRIRSGDTLSKIAEQWRQGTEETIRSTSHWLFENNPNAFSGDNEHLLIAGSLLRLPKRSALPLSTQAVDTLSDSPLQEKTKIDSTPASAEVKQGRLRLAETGAAHLLDLAKASRAQLSTDLDSNQELLDQLRRENEDLRGRLNKLEGSDYVQMLTRLIELQNLQIDRLREGAAGGPANSAELLLASSPPSERPVLGAALAPVLAGEPVATLVASALTVGAVSRRSAGRAGVTINEMTAAALSKEPRESLRSWWQIGLLLGLPLLAVGLCLLMCIRLRSQHDAVVARGAELESLAEVDHWQPVVTEDEDMLWPEAVVDDLAERGALLGDITLADDAVMSVEGLGKPLLLLDEVLDEVLNREFEALVEAADFDPADEFPDAGDTLFDQALAGISEGAAAPEAEAGVESGSSPESEELKAAIVAAAAASDSDSLKSTANLSSFNDSFEGLLSVNRHYASPQVVDELPGIDQDFGSSDGEHKVAPADSLIGAPQESEFELSRDQQAEFEEDWLDESSLAAGVNPEPEVECTNANGDEREGVDDSSELSRRRDDVTRNDDVLMGVAKVLQFQRRRSDAEVRQSIQVKTSDYTPPDEAYVVCDCDDDTILSLDFNLIDDPEFSAQGLNVDGFESTDQDSAAEVAAEQVIGKADPEVNAAGSDVAAQPLFVDLQFRASDRERGAP